MECKMVICGRGDGPASCNVDTLNWMNRRILRSVKISWALKAEIICEVEQ